MFTVGLTGGIASGKSTVCDLFADLGVEIIDADIIAREVVEPGQPALSEISNRFGSELIDTDGRLKRRALRQVVFSKPELRKELESILHPIIRKAIWAKVSRCSGPYCILAIPLLVEGGLHSRVDRVLVVDVDEVTQRSRLRARDRISDEEIDRILSAQTHRESRLKVADDLIDNNGSEDALPPQVEMLHQRYLKLALIKGDADDEQE